MFNERLAHDSKAGDLSGSLGTLRIESAEIAPKAPEIEAAVPDVHEAIAARLHADERKNALSSEPGNVWKRGVRNEKPRWKTDAEDLHLVESRKAVRPVPFESDQPSLLDAIKQQEADLRD